MRRLKGSACRLRFAVAIGLAVGLSVAGASAQPAFVVRPYLMDPTPRSMAVLFETPVACATTVTATTGDGHVAARAEGRAATMHELVLSGLSPSTAYRYRVETASGATAEGRFTTSSESDGTPVRMIVYGDSRSDAAAHLAVTRAIATEGADLVVHTGDMVDSGDREPEWHEALLALAPVVADVPFVPVLGNHELVPPSGAGLPTWRKYVRAPAASPEGETSYVVRNGPLVLIVMDAFADWAEGPAARVWLTQALREAHATPGVRQVMAALHHGPMSSGYHGENRDIRDAGIDGVLLRGGVSLVLSGHDHDYERGDDRGLKYIVSGGGGAPLYPVNREQPYELAFETSFHYVLVEVSGERVEVTAKRTDGSIIDRCGFKGRGAWRCPGAADGRGRIQAGSASALGAASRWATIGALSVATIAGAILIVRSRRARRRGGPT